MKTVLAFNAGSSSIKFMLYDNSKQQTLAYGNLEGIGTNNCQFLFYNKLNNSKDLTQQLQLTNHTDAVRHIINHLKSEADSLKLNVLELIAHRIVHGGEELQKPMIINNDVLAAIENMTPLAPLHNPASLASIEASRELFANTPQVAVFDTSFFRTLLPQAYLYAIPIDLYQNQQIRRYGFHGISHQYVSRAAANYLNQSYDSLRLITLHLGNGASIAAIRDGQCIDTSMGMTPLEGLVMGTRCGDIDPSIPFFLAKKLQMSFEKIETLLNSESGLLGLCGHSDMREIHNLAEAGNPQARLAIDIFCYRITKYVGAYFAALGGLDALIFTAGIGENDALIRQTICDRLSALNLFIDNDLNHSPNPQIIINSADSVVKILVIPTNEELEIIHQAVEVAEKK